MIKIVPSPEDDVGLAVQVKEITCCNDDPTFRLGFGMDGEENDGSLSGSRLYLRCTACDTIQEIIAEEDDGETSPSREQLINSLKMLMLAVEIAGGAGNVLKDNDRKLIDTIVRELKPLIDALPATGRAAGLLRAAETLTKLREQEE